MRIIPAYAGNTGSKPASTSSMRDHPRICGEHVCHASSYLLAMGSSPHMRGTLAGTVNRVHGGGIIPAYAGNTSNIFHHMLPNRDHPRICGEHSLRKLNMSQQLGSSPHMRGTLRGSGVGARQRGIIPAYAGNTGCPDWRTCAAQDHPRICGEHLCGQGCYLV